MVIDPGESIIGYQYLHGTNSKAGGFTIKGKIVKGRANIVTYKCRYTWNDIIDPNFYYYTDRIKNQVAKIISLGKCKSYYIHLKWDDTSTITRKGRLGANFGWLAK